MFSKIVVGLDGSEISKTALRLACDLANKYGSELYLVHTPEPQTVAFALGAVSGYHTATTMPASEKITEAADKIINSGKAIAKEYGLSVTHAQVKRGNPANAIVACATGCGADLIVTGRRGLGSISALVQGSTSQQIGHLAKCACLSVV